MGKKIIDQIGALGRKAKAATVDSSRTKVPKFYQVSIIYKKLCEKRNFLDKPFYINIQYVSPEIFLTEIDAEKFVPYFIKRLIEDGLVGNEVVKEDKTVDLSLVTPGIAPLIVAMIEADDEYNEKMERGSQ